MRDLETLTECQFKGLQEIGLLYELYPAAPLTWDDTAQAKHEKARYLAKCKSREKSQKSKEKMLPRLRDWILKNLKPGMRVKMSGCKDKKGIREVLGTRELGTQSGDSLEIECRQIIIQRIYNPDMKRSSTEEKLGQITSHGFQKLQNVFIDDKWVKIKDLI